MEREIVTLLFFFSFFGILAILWKKIPELAVLPEEKKESFTGRTIRKLKEQISRIKFFKSSFWLLTFEKTLRKIRILSLKLDNFTFRLSRRLKERTNEKKDDFWDKIKEEVKDKPA